MEQKAKPFHLVPIVHVSITVPFLIDMDLAASCGVGSQVSLLTTFGEVNK